METPSIEHLSAKDFENIYEPAEDSFLLLDALEADLPYLENLQPRVCLEIGSGSGVIITALAKILKNSLCLATDINLNACKATQKTAKYNKTHVDAINCNLLDAIQMNSIDLLIFNPPYVVTTDEEFDRMKFESAQPNLCNDNKTQKGLFSTWAGGLNGRRVTDIILKSLHSILSNEGVFYLLLLRENKPDEVIKQLELFNFNAIKFMERRIPGEHLCILKITR